MFKLFKLVLAAQQLRECVFHENKDVVLAQTRDDVLVDAHSLQVVELEEVSQPQHVLHQVYVLALLVFVTAGPKHFSRVDVIENNPECLCG